MPDSDAKSIGAAVVIVSRNRSRDVTHAIESSLSQTYDPLEILVYNDCSTDDTHQVVESRFPSVRLFTTDKSRGYIPLRNRGLDETSADYVFSLDDDAYFASSETVRRVVEIFEADSTVAAIGLPYCEPRRRTQNVMDSNVAPLMELRSYVGCAHAVRVSAVRGVGGYREFFFHQGEERDLCIRLMECGYRIVYADTPPIVHTVSPVRDRMRMMRFGIRNTLLFDWLNFPFPDAWIRMAADSVRMLFYKFTLWDLPFRLWYLAMGLAACAKYTSHRKPVSRATYRKFRSLPRHGPIAVQADTVSAAPSIAASLE